MVRPVAGDLPEQVKNNQSVNMAAGNGGQKMSQYPWFTVYQKKEDAWHSSFPCVPGCFPILRTRLQSGPLPLPPSGPESSA